MAGRGSFIESFPLFGYDLDDYDELFAEKLELLLELRESERVTWSGAHRAPLDDLGVYPRPVQDPLPVWIAVGGTPESAVRAGTLGLPMALAIIGGQPERFAPFVDALPRAPRPRRGHEPPRCRSASTRTATSPRRRAAGDEFFPAYAAMMNRDRPRARLAADARARTSTRCARRAARSSSAARRRSSRRSSSSTSSSATQRFLAQMSVGSLPHDAGAALDRAARHRGRAGRARGGRPARDVNELSSSTGSGTSSSCTPTSARATTPSAPGGAGATCATSCSAGIPSRHCPLPMLGLSGVPLYDYDSALRVLGTVEADGPRAARSCDVG